VSSPDPDDPLSVLSADDQHADRRRLVRLAAGLCSLVLAVVWFRGPLGELWPMLWPPGGPRWATLVLVVAFSLVLPMMVGAALVDVLYRRR